MTLFQESVLKVVRLAPTGKVMSYGQVAAYIGMPRAARQVGWAMHALKDAPHFPWWRIVNNAGLITIKDGELDSKKIQAELLRGEGIDVDEQLRLDIERFRFRPDVTELQHLGLDPDYARELAARFDQNRA